MPVMNGFEFLTHLHKNEKWHLIPVIVLTVINITAEEYTYLNKHVETIFKKQSFSQNELIQHIHQMIVTDSSRTEQDKKAEQMASFFKNVN